MLEKPNFPRIKHKNKSSAVFFAVSLSLTNQPVENRVVGLAESSWGVELHHLPSLHHQYPVTVHDGVDPVDTSN